MRNPQRLRTIALAVAATGLTACAIAIVRDTPKDWIQAVLFAYGSPALMLGAATALFAHFDVRAKSRLASGEGVLARWTVDAARWNAFCQIDAALNAKPGGLINEANLRSHAPGDHIEVTIGRDAIDVDHSIHRLDQPVIEGADLIEGVLPYVAFVLLYPATAKTSSHRSALRFPMPPGAEASARQIVDHFAAGRHLASTVYHGPGDGSDSDDLSICQKCGFQTHDFVARCPRCHAPVTSKRWIRRYGITLIVCGLLLTAIMSVVTFKTAALLLHPGQDFNGSRFSGTRSAGAGILALFSTILVFGLVTLTDGVWRVATRQIPRITTRLMLALGAFALIALAAVLLGPADGTPFRE